MLVFFSIGASHSHQCVIWNWRCDSLH